LFFFTLPDSEGDPTLPLVRVKHPSGANKRGPPDVSKFSNVFERFFVVPEPAALFRNVDALENEETLGLGQSYCKETYTPTVTVPLLTNLSLRDRFGFLKNPRT
jgi:hypothetical protein